MAETQDDLRGGATAYAWIAGLGLSGLGVVGFFYSDMFGAGADLAAEEMFGILAVNGWTNVLHVLTGVLGLAAAGSRRGSRAYALGNGTLYLLIAIWGFALGSSGSVADPIAVNTAGNVLHAAIGLAGITIGLRSRGRVGSANGDGSTPREDPRAGHRAAT